MRKLLERFLIIPDDKLPKSVDVIVGIGAGLYCVLHDSWKETVLSLQSEEVLSSVIELFEKDKSKLVFFSGGYSYRGRYEASLMCHKFLHIIRRRIKFVYPTFEIDSKNSLGNVVETLKWMKENNCKSAIIVDFSGHLKQIKRIFLKQTENRRMNFYFVNAHSGYGGNIQTRLNDFYLFFIWELLTNIYYKLKGAL